MARLRYNGLVATLGAALTSSATSVTFGAALTYNGAAATPVPTIAGSDYIPLTILDASGNVSEIVSLTAYTSGATTGTISRAQEGTTGVAHSSGDKVVHGPTAADIGAVLAAKVIQTAGNYTINNTAWTTLDSTLDLTVAAATGDVIEVGLSAYVVPNATNQYAALDAVTVVSGSAVTSFSNGAGTPALNGIPAWNIPGPAGEKGMGGSVMLTLGSGDISGGTATVRLRYKTGNAVNHTVRANTSDPLQFWVKNLRH